MSNIVDDVVRSYDRDLGDAVVRKVRNYISLLASTGKSEQELFALGQAYLDEALKPDRRYSGC
jgi:hypothetical protein